MSEKMKNKFRPVFGGSIAVILAALFAVSILYIQRTRDSMWNSLTLNALELTKSGADSLASKLDSETASLENLAWLLEKYSCEDVENIQNLVRSFSGEDATQMEVFDLDCGVVYTTVKTERQPISDTQMEKFSDYGDSGWLQAFYSLYDGKRYIGYYKRFHFTNGAEGILRKEIEIKSLGEQYSLTFYNNQGYSYVIDADGDIIVRPQDRYSNRTFNNVFDVINAGANSLESLETLRNAIDQGKNGIMTCNFDGEAYVIAFSAIQGTDSWSLMSLIPKAAFTAHMDSIMRVSYLVIISLAIVIVVMLIYVFYWNQLKQKEKDNIILVEAAQKAEAANLAKSKFLSHMSHDIRTPINGIMGMTSIAIKNIDDTQRVRDCLLKIEGSSRHLLSLINDVLDMSRIESGKTQLLHESFDIRTCLANCASIIDGQLATREVKFIREFEEFENPIVVGDELHLRQILINILGNSVKFTPDGKTIYFRAKRMDKDGVSGFRFEIEDEGIGMKAEFLPHIFEPFSQEDGGTRTSYKGTGIGMSITKSLVELMGGTIQVTSTLNEGTKFVLEIPMKTDADAVVEHTAQEDSFNLKGMKILLVEDNELNMEIAKEILEDEGITVTCAENGEIALEIYEESAPGTFDAILMDLMMPVMDGLTAAQKIREMDRTDAQMLPILAMTANAFDEDIQKTRDAGMNAHLSKPIQVEVLYATLAKFYMNKKKDTSEKHEE
jgi:signal transduction histidine kinase/ActR/RegA family two-component response regulator